MLARLNEFIADGIHKTAAGEFLYKESENFDRERRHEIISKASALTVEDNAGAGEASYIWINAQTGNPFLPYARIIEAGKVDRVQAPRLDNIPAVTDGAIDPADDGTAGEVPDAADTVQIKIKHYEQTLRAAPSAVEDLPDFEQAHAALAIESLFAQSGKDMFAAIKGNADIGSNTESKTGVADGLPTVANVEKVIGDWMEKIAGQYHRFGSLHVNPRLWNILQQASSGDLGYGDWKGVNLQVSGALDGGAAAGDVVAVFGDLHYGLIFAMRRDVAVKIYRNHKGGSGDLFYASARFGTAVLEPAAVGRLVVGA